VVAIAESFEASAAEVYRQAAGSSARPEVRQTLLGLAEMEDNHLRAFKELRRLLAARPFPSGREGREAGLLEAWLGREVFAGEDPPRSELSRADSVEAWLETAVGMEKDSIAFYSGLRTLLDEGQRPVLDTIIDEEVYHLASLSYLLRTLRRGQRPGPTA
jgi:rubrerythrin